MDMNQDVTQYIREAIHTPDGITALVVSIAFTLAGLFPQIPNALGHMFGFSLRGAAISFLFVPPMILVSFIWLNAFSRTKKLGSYVNAAILIIGAILMVNSSISFG